MSTAGRHNVNFVIRGLCRSIPFSGTTIIEFKFLNLVMVFFSIVDHPKDVGMVDEDLTAEEDQAPIVENDFLENGEEAEEDEELTRANNSADGEKPQFLRVLALPGVLPYSISFFALKLVNYSFFFWLPYFLHNKYHWSDETGAFRMRFNESLGYYSTYNYRKYNRINSKPMTKPTFYRHGLTLEESLAVP